MTDQSLMGRAAGFYDGFAKVLSAGQHLFLLFIRLYFGYQCAQAGWGHLKNFQATVEAFIGWNIPIPKVSVAVAATTELVGGVMLMAGFLSRLISIPLVFNFLVAIVSVSLADPDFHDKILHFWKYPNVVINDTAFPFLCTALIVMLFGPGVVSLDAVLRKVLLPKKQGRGFPVAQTTGAPRY